MSKSLSDIEKVVAVAEIQRFGDKLTLPEGMKLETAIDLLQRRAEYEEEETEFSESYDVFPFDGAHALNEVLIRMYGWAPATGTPFSASPRESAASSLPGWPRSQSSLKGPSAMSFPPAASRRKPSPSPRTPMRRLPSAVK